MPCPGYDPNDPGSVDARIPDFHAASLTPQDAPRIGLVRKHFWEKASQETRDHADSIAQRLADAGATVEDADLPTDHFGKLRTGFDEMLWAHRILMTTEGADAHREWFDGRADDYSPNVRRVIEDGLKASAVDYLKAKQVQAAFSRDMGEAMRPFDVVMTPATPTAAPRDLSSTGDPMFPVAVHVRRLPDDLTAVGIRRRGDAAGDPAWRAALGMRRGCCRWRRGARERISE